MLSDLGKYDVPLPNRTPVGFEDYSVVKVLLDLKIRIF